MAKIVLRGCGTSAGKTRDSQRYDKLRGPRLIGGRKLTTAAPIRRTVVATKSTSRATRALYTK